VGDFQQQIRGQALIIDSLGCKKGPHLSRDFDVEDNKLVKFVEGDSHKYKNGMLLRVGQCFVKLPQVHRNLRLWAPFS
jgi:hypothetical protein